MDPRDVRRMFSLIIDICERIYFSQPQQQTSQQYGGQVAIPQAEIFDEKVYQLPSFIESLACVCGQLDDPLPEGTSATLERLVCLAIDSYPMLLKRYNYQLSLAVAHLFLSLQIGKFSFYNEFVARVVYQSLVRIFSYRTKYSLQQEHVATTGQNLDDEFAVSQFD